MSYLNVNEVETAIALATAPPFSAFTQLITLPNPTWEGRQSHAIKIGNGSDPGRPGVFFLGGVHGREWGSADILVNLIQQLLAAYQAGTGLTFGTRIFSDSEIQKIVNTLDIVVFPLANPDGRNESLMGGDPMWRKNRRVTAPNSAACPGVDINRNFDFVWDFPTYFSPVSGTHTSTDPCHPELYHGPAAFSEPETRNIKWIFENFPNTRSFIDVHLGGNNCILYRWGIDEAQSTDPTMNFRNPAYDLQRGALGDAYKEYIPPNDLAEAVNLANTLCAGIQAVRGTVYTAQSSSGLYSVSGAADDYAYSRHIVDPGKEKVTSLTIECTSDYQPLYPEMQQVISEVTCGLLAFCLKIVEMEDAMAWQITGNSTTVPGTNFLGTTDNQPLAIKTNGSERLRIDTTGNIGVGMTNPSSNLHIDVPGSSNPISALTVDVQSFGTPANAQASHFFRVRDIAGGSTPFYVRGDGNTGIGTDQPSARLSVVASGATELTGSARSAALLTSAGALGITANDELALATIGFHSGNNSSLGIRALRVANGADWYSTAIGLGMDVDNTRHAGATLWLHANGSVGIGTASPRTKLEVAGGAIVSGVVIGADVAGINYPFEYETLGVANPGFNLRLQSPNSIIFHTGNPPVEKLGISPAGNFGIGTIQPNARLSVVAPGATELTGSTRSATLLTSAGNLGAAAGNELALATIGFHSGNNSSLGIRALRVVNGSDWPSTAIGLEMDVDNTRRAGASLWLHANGNIGIGTTTPAAGGKIGVVSNSPDTYAVKTQNTGGGGAIAGSAQGSLYPAVVGLALGAGAGVHGYAAQTAKTSIGVIGTVGGTGPYLFDAALTGGFGVLGHSIAGSGVGGASEGTGAAANGVEGFTGGAGAGLHGSTSNLNGVGIFAQNDQAVAGGLSARFIGNVSVQGKVTSSGKGFKIDHPLHPRDKYLTHSSIEGPDMMNVYNGNITTKKSGEAVVELPDYFEALNHDFKYQLTVIGEFAQAVVAQEIKGNRFVIKTDRANVKVSWQVTGIRKDAYAEAYRMVVEETKPETERGRYLHPELYKTRSSKRDARRPIGAIPNMFGQKKQISLLAEG